MAVRINGEICPLSGKADWSKPKPEAPVYKFAIPRTLLNRGYNLIEISPKQNCQIVWAEISIETNKP